jgi:hypothetical protein
MMTAGRPTCRRELAHERQMLEFLAQRSANVAEFIAMVRRGLGEPMELQEADAVTLRPYITSSL